MPQADQLRDEVAGGRHIVGPHVGQLGALELPAADEDEREVLPDQLRQLLAAHVAAEQHTAVGDLQAVHPA